MQTNPNNRVVSVMTSVSSSLYALTLSLLITLSAGQTIFAQDNWGELFQPSVPRAIERGLKPDGNLYEELYSIQYERITTVRQAKALVQLLKALPMEHKLVVPGLTLPPQKYYDPLYSINLRQLLNIVGESTPADNYIKQQGMPEVLRLYDFALEQYKSEQSRSEKNRKSVVVIPLLEICANSQTEEGTRRVIEALQGNVAPESYGWRTVLEAFNYSHPQSKQLYAYLSQNIPDGELGYGVLSAVNSRAGIENTFDHIFDSDKGMAILQRWLASDDIDLAFEVIATIPHLKPARQAELFKLVDASPNVFVRLESARQKVRDDDAAGFKQLAELCLDVHVSTSAQETLKELDKDSMIPPAVLKRPFAVEAAIYGSLQDSDRDYQRPGAGQARDIQVVEELNLPVGPGEEPLRATIVRFKWADNDDPLNEGSPGVAIIGEETACYLDKFETYLTQEDLISVYYFEDRLQHFTSVEDAGSAEESASYRSQWTGPEWTPQIVYKCTFDEMADYPSPVVLFSLGKMNDVSGFMVFDQERSRFYPADQFHPSTGMYQVFRLHCGRVARGLPVDIERPKFSQSVTPAQATSPAQVVQQCEALLEEVKSGSLKRRKQLLLDYDSVLLTHLTEYIDAVVSLRQADRDEVLIATVDRLFDAHAALSAEVPQQRIGLSSFDELMHDYVRSPKLDTSKAAAHFERLAPLCETIHEAEWIARLGMRAGQLDQAQTLLAQRLLNNRGINSSLLFTLTEILVTKGQVDQAVYLHVEAYKDLIRHGSRVDLDESEWIDEDVEEHLNKMREQIPDRYEAALKEAGLDGDFKVAVQNYRKRNSKRGR